MQLHEVVEVGDNNKRQASKEHRSIERRRKEERAVVGARSYIHICMQRVCMHTVTHTRIYTYTHTAKFVFLHF